MKLKNAKVGLTVQYKGGDEDEHIFEKGETGVIADLSRHLKHSIEVDGPDKGSVFQPEYLRIVKEEKPENTVAGYKMSHGHIDSKAQLAAKLVILPQHNKYIAKANATINKWVNGDISFREMYSLWSALSFHGDAGITEYKRKTKIALDYMIENNLV
jgi:hypothetical protein